MTRVAVTGAHGRVGRLLIPRLVDLVRVTCIDLQQPPHGQHPKADFALADIGDTPTLTRVLQDHDAVVHLAAKASTKAAWEDLIEPNVRGAIGAFEAAKAAGVGRFVFASTNHVTGLVQQREGERLTPEAPVQPDCPYAVTKAFGEALGRYYADTTDTKVICLRIGWALAAPHNEQAREMWLSPRDLLGYVLAALSTDIRFGIYYAVSANEDRPWSLEPAVHELGYRPVDGFSTKRGAGPRPR